MNNTFAEINNYNEFINALLKVGMSTGGEKNTDGVFALCDYYGKSVQWHTEDIDTDPWEWRIRVLDERNDIAYSKLFFKKSGFITANWYPYFYAVRRGLNSFEEEYSDGNISFYAKKIYELISREGTLPLHIIKQLGNFTKEDKTKFDNAITELQMKMYITMCGRSKKYSKTGQEYGWSSTTFCKTEVFFSKEIFEKAKQIAVKATEKYLQKENLTDMNELNCFIRFYEYIVALDEQSEISRLIPLNKLRERLIDDVTKAISTNTAEWKTSYICKPSQFLNSPASIFYSKVKEIAQYETNFIIHTLKPEGYWNVTWSWGSYPEEWSISRNWWQANQTIINMRYLKGFEWM